MSGYLPPHTKEGPHSKVFKSDYPLVSSAYDASSSEYPICLPRNVIPTVHTLIVLDLKDKSTDLKIPVLGFGLWPWGDVLTYGWAPSGGYDLNLNEDSIATAFDAMFRYFPKVLVDTAEHYGYTDGLSETNLGKLYEQKMKDHRERIAFATKYLPTPWRHPWRYPDIVIESMGGSLSRTKLGHIDIYQLHAPSHWGIWPRLETICIALAEAYKTGHIRAIGVCNLSVDQTKYVYEELKKRDVPLVSNQVEFSLLRTEPWKNGLIEWGRQNGIATIAYSPLGVSRLTGKYSADILPRGNRNFGRKSWSKIQPIIDELLRIGRKVGKTPTAVSLNWVMCKGAIPIPGVKNGEQVDDIVQCLGWRLNSEDEAALNAVGLAYDWDWNILKHFQNWWWQQG